MRDRRQFSWTASLLALLAICGDGQGHPREPQATFALKGGWVECTLRQDGKPVANATIQIIDENGKPYASGETLAKGEADFPMPPGASFIVEIKAGVRTADPIRLFKNQSVVEPARVLLSYGLRPCCRSIKTPSEAAPVDELVEVPSSPGPEPIAWHFLVPALACLSMAVVVLLMMWRR